jgi:hypothetical protein
MDLVTVSTANGATNSTPVDPRALVAENQTNLSTSLDSASASELLGVDSNTVDGKIAASLKTPEDANSSQAGPQNSPSISGLSGYRWNLPPHQWSRSVEPSEDSFVVPTSKYVLGSVDKIRRGRIYWYARVDTDYVDSTEYNTGKSTRAKDPRYGFQFMWNPDSYSTSVTVNTNITPSFSDAFVGVVGAFPSGEYLTLTLRLDRTNDFACIKSLPKGDPATTTTYTQNIEKFSSYYAGGFDTWYAPGQGYNITDKIVELQQKGTLADIEYLYKAINGPGWSNPATGSNSSDIGFLMPTLVKIDIGPVSYLGYVNNLSVTHSSFTKDMIPIRSDVNLQFNLMATAGLSSK